MTATAVVLALAVPALAGTVAGPYLLDLLGIEPPQELAEFAGQAGGKGQSVVSLVRGGRAGGRSPRSARA